MIGQGEEPDEFEVEQNLETITSPDGDVDSKTNHILTMSVERGPAPPPPPGGAAGPRARRVFGTFTILVIGK